MTAGPDPTRMLDGDSVYRVVWVPGTDRLVGHHPGGATHESDDPVELWDWLLSRPGPA